MFAEASGALGVFPSHWSMRGFKNEAASNKPIRMSLEMSRFFLSGSEKLVQHESGKSGNKMLCASATAG